MATAERQRNAELCDADMPVQFVLTNSVANTYPEAPIVRSDPLWPQVIFTTTIGFRD